MPEIESIKSILQSKNIILFDSECKLCSAWSRFVIRYDRQEQFKLCSVQSNKGRQLLQYFDYPVDRFDTMVYIENETAFDKSTALLKVLKQFPMPFKMAFIGWIIPKSIRDYLYTRVAVYRYKLFGRKHSCLLPENEHNSRFL